MQELESIRKKAGLNIVEFTNILPIERSTYYGWLNAEHAPDPFRIEVCLDYADLINDCINNGLLPLSGLPRGKRMDEIRAVLKKCA